MRRADWNKKQYKTNYRPAYEALMRCYPFTIRTLDGEEWRPISGYEGLYQVSNLGRVKSSHNSKEQKILSPALSSRGYLFVVLHKNGCKKTFRLNRLVAITFIANPENKPEVDHIDGHKLNNHVSNLQWATRSENQNYALALGLRKHGEKHDQSKRTSEQVLYIRENPHNLAQRKLAEKFGVAKTTIADIQRGKKYKDIGGNVREAYTQPQNKTPDDVRKKIKEEYVFGSKEFGCYGLARKYGIGSTTVHEIIKSK